MSKAEEILDKHLSDYDTECYIEEDRKLRQHYVDAVNEALNIGINTQVEILKKVIDKLMITFDNESDRIDYILDICNEYKKEASEIYK